jgi:glucosyl-dolichyl phosphate glucuronosyltransferase
MHASVVICTWNRERLLAKALDSIESMDVPNHIEWEVLIVDNNSADGTRSVSGAFVDRRPDRYRYVFEGRQGKSYALNAALEQARGDILLFTDDDVTVHPQWLAQILGTFADFRCGIVAGKIVAVWERPVPHWFVTEGPNSLMAAIVRFDHGTVAGEIDATPFGANMAIRRELFARLGGFRTDLGPTASSELRGEDTEICRRFRGAGEKVVYAPNAIVYHPVEAKRAQKEYFLAWYFDFGRSQIVMHGLSAEMPSYFGIPRFQFRRLAEYVCRWWLSIDRRRRFHFKLSTWQTLGEMVESHRRSAAARGQGKG